MQREKLRVVCRRCGFGSDDYRQIICPECGGVMSVETFRVKINGNFLKAYIDSALEILDDFKGKLKLNEGWTPLIKSVRKEEVFFKDEGRNPTGSFRDRAAPLIVSDAINNEKKEIILASDGNMAVSVACFSSRANIRTTIYAPYWVDEEKIYLAKAYGANILIKNDSLDRLLKYVEKRAKREKLYDASSVHNVLSLEGLKTISYEIAIQSKIDDIDYIYVPLGSGLTYLALYLGLEELRTTGLISKIPKIIGVELCSNPLYSMYLKNVKICKDNILPGLSYKNPPIFEAVIDTIRKAGDTEVVTFKETIDATKNLLKNEGIFTEPSSAVSYSALLKTETLNSIVILTGHGFKSWSSLAKPSRKRSYEIFPHVTKSHILELIEKNPGITGYEIWKKLGIKISVQAIYQHLWELESMNLVYSIKENKKRKYYRK